MKIVGVTDQQIVTRVGNKRRLVYCDNEALLADILEMVPVSGEGTFVEDTLVAFDTRENDKAPTDGVKDENA